MSASNLAGAAGDIYISPKFNVGDWKALEMRSSEKPDWDKAIEIFHDRISGRFLKPVDSMRNHHDPRIAEFAGFTILAIDCILIEALGQFYHGFGETPGHRDTRRNPSRKWHREFYVEFMRGFARISGEGQFNTDPIRELFYDHFRCGILHQAQTKRKSRVRFDEDQMVAFADPADHLQGLVVDRDRLHDALVKEIYDYEDVLRKGTDRKKRDDFVDKMDFIAS